MPAGNVTARLNLNAAGWSAAVTQAQKQMQGLHAATLAMGHAVPSQMQAASASIRLLEGGLNNNIRAAERFVSMIPGMGSALLQAFPLAGGIAFAGLLYRTYGEINAFIQKAREMPQAISSGFESLQLSAQTSVSEIDVMNDKLENQIAKLEHKPQNNLKLAIDEAKVSADDFAKSIEQASKSVGSLLETNKITMLQSFFADTERTTPLAGTIKSYENDKQHLATQAAIRKNLGDEYGYQDFMKQFHDKEQSEMQKMQDAFGEAQRKAAMTDHDTPVYQSQQAIESTSQGVADQIQLSRSRETALNRRTADQTQLDRAQKAAEALEEYKRAQQALVEQWRQALGDDKAFNQVSVEQEASYWAYRAETVAKGSLAYKAALQEANKGIAAINAESMSTQKGTGKKWIEFGNISEESYRPSAMDLSRGDTGDMKEQGRAAADYLKSLNAGIALQHQNSDAIAEASIQMDLMTGRINRLGAAQMEAALHAREYRDAISAIDAALENAQSLPQGFDKQSTIAQLTKQRNQATATYQIQSAQDQYNVSTQQSGTAERQALAVMMQNWSNMTGQIVRIMTQGIDSLNDDIVKAMTGRGKASDFGKTFSQAGEGLMKASLQKLEAGVFGKAIGKPDGTQQNPLYTIDAAKTAGVSGNLSPYFRPFFGGQQGQGGSGGGGGGGILGSIFGKLFGGGGGDAAANGASDALGGAAGGIGDALGDAFSGFAGFFARGGDVLANHPAVVGEGGPEVFVPRTAGRIVPNDQLGGGDSHYHFHVDARGSNDPMAIEAAVRRGVNQSMVGSVHMQHQIRMRTPHGR